MSFLLIEVIEAMQGVMAGLSSFAALQLAVEEAGLLPVGVLLTEPQALDLLSRINEKPAAAEKEVSEGIGLSKKRSYGTDFLAKFSKLSVVGKCLFAADYDYQRAEFLYCSCDKSVAEKVISEKIEMYFAARQMDYEAVVLGMGGSFRGGSQEDVDHSENLEPGSQEFVDAAKAFMAMQHQYTRK